MEMNTIPWPVSHSFRTTIFLPGSRETTRRRDIDVRWCYTHAVSSDWAIALYFRRLKMTENNPFFVFRRDVFDQRDFSTTT